MAWAAKAADAGIDGRVSIGHVVSVAMEVRRLQATCVLALDPFDEEVAELWMNRYGFRAVAPPRDAESEPSRRLWINLDRLQ